MLKVVSRRGAQSVPRRLHYASGRRPSTTLRIGPPLLPIGPPGRAGRGDFTVVDSSSTVESSPLAHAPGACMDGDVHTQTLLLLGQIRNLQVAPVGGLDEFYLQAHALSWTESDSVKGSV